MAYNAGPNRLYGWIRAGTDSARGRAPTPGGCWPSTSGCSRPSPRRPGRGSPRPPRQAADAGHGDLPEHPGGGDAGRPAVRLRPLHRLRPALHLVRQRLRLPRRGWSASRPSIVAELERHGAAPRLPDRGRAAAAAGPAGALPRPAGVRLGGDGRDPRPARCRGAAAGGGAHLRREAARLGRGDARLRLPRAAPAARRGEVRGGLGRGLRLVGGGGEAPPAAGAGGGPLLAGGAGRRAQGAGGVAAGRRDRGAALAPAAQADLGRGRPRASERGRPPPSGVGIGPPRQGGNIRAARRVLGAPAPSHAATGPGSP